MKKPTHSASSTPNLLAGLSRCAGIALLLIFLAAGCSSQLPAATQSAPVATETAAPTVTQPPATVATPTATLPPRLSPTPTNPPPTETSAPTSPPQQALEPSPTPTGAAISPESTATYVPLGSGVTFQIKNQTNRTILIYGYDMSKTIPSGLTVYYQAPAWGAISLRVCHKNKDNSAGGCYIFYGTISESNPVIVITKG